MPVDTSSALIGGGGILGLGFLASAWGRIRGFFTKIWGLVFITIKTDDWHLQRAMRAYLWNTCERKFVGNGIYGMFRTFVRSKDRNEYVAFEKLGKVSTTFWNGWKPMFVSSNWSDEATEKGDNGMSVSFFRWTFDREKLLTEIVRGYNRTLNNRLDEFQAEQRRFTIKYVVGDLIAKKLSESPGADSGRNSGKSTTLYDDEVIIGDRRYVGYEAFDLGFSSAQGGSAMDNLALSEKQQALVANVEHWLASREWYKERAIPWKRGLLLTGPPGSGKTSLVRAVAEDMDLPVWIYDLATLTNRDFITNWRSMLGSTPCIALIEDIDAVFDGRENTTDVEGGLTFNCLLNAVDGVERTDGVMFVVTTNCREKLDPALAGKTRHGVASRPGRVDRVLNFGPMEEGCRRQLAERILCDCPEETVEKLVDEGDGDVAEQFQERCRKVALEYYWENMTKPDGKAQGPEVELKSNNEAAGVLTKERQATGGQCHNLNDEPERITATTGEAKDEPLLDPSNV